jgi:Fasciclin domain
VTSTPSFATTFSSPSWSTLYARTDNLEYLLQERYPSFHLLLLKDNVDVWKRLNAPETIDFTIFCPTQQAFEKLGEQKCNQLQDVRNAEATMKMGAYHVICEQAVTPDLLFNSAGVITLGGQVPVDRSVTGGMFFGIGGKEDGGSVIGGSAKVLQSYTVPCGEGGNNNNKNAFGIIHEVDALISPSILWRYMDQLRIPLSK